MADASGGAQAPAAGASEPGTLPPWYRNSSLYSFLATESLGAFNDNVFKQLVLLLCVGHTFAGVEFQTIVAFLFAIPFLLLSGFAGDLADRYCKGTLMQICKVAEVVIMLMGLGIFLVYSQSGESFSSILWLLAIATCLMGTHSTFFGPPKYAGLPELVRKEDLGRATGLTQMTTFLAIVFGFTFAGFLMDRFHDRLWVTGVFGVAIAVLGSLTALGIARVPASDPGRKIGLGSFWSPIADLIALRKSDRMLYDVMIIYSWFWLIGGVALSAVNSYGRHNLGLTNLETSMMVSILTVGMAVGSVTVGYLSGSKIRMWLIVPGIVGIVLLMCAFPFMSTWVSGPENSVPDAVETAKRASQDLRVTAYAAFAGLGVFVGFFTVPLVTLVQARPSADQKGRTIAAFSWLSWLFIVGAALVYGGGMYLAEVFVGENRADVLMAGVGVLTALMGLWKLPGIFRALRTERPEYVSV